MGELASPSDPSTWAAFEDVACYAAGHGLGAGFVFSIDDPYCGIDLDRCTEQDGIEVWAKRLVDLFGSYCELSPSGTGLHVIVRAKLPAGGNRKGAVEIYDRSRFFCMTGNVWQDRVTPIRDCQNEVEALQRDLFGITRRPGLTVPLPPRQQGAYLPRSDNERLHMARSSVNGTKFRVLYDAGDWRDWDTLTVGSRPRLVSHPGFLAWV